MADYILRANIAHYKKLLEAETDARKIEKVWALLTEEETNLADWQIKNSKPPQNCKASAPYRP